MLKALLFIILARILPITKVVQNSITKGVVWKLQNGAKNTKLLRRYANLTLTLFQII